MDSFSVVHIFLDLSDGSEGPARSTRALVLDSVHEASSLLEAGFCHGGSQLGGMGLGRRVLFWESPCVDSVEFGLSEIGCFVEAEHLALRKWEVHLEQVSSVAVRDLLDLRHGLGEGGESELIFGRCGVELLVLASPLLELGDHSGGIAGLLLDAREDSEGRHH